MLCWWYTDVLYSCPCGIHSIHSCMSAQCWCFSCRGRVVGRKTFIKHGRMNRPVAPLQPQRLPVLSMPEPEHVDEEHEGSGGDTDEDDYAEWVPLGLGGVHAGESKLTPPEIILLFLDWMCKHKLTDSAAKDLWTLMSTFMPEGVDLPAFHVLKKMLSKSELKSVQRLDLCPNDCIVYWDSKHLSSPYRHAHRDRCPVCGQPRYVNDPKDGKQRSAKTIFLSS